MPDTQYVDGAATQADQVYGELRADILSCRLLPGAKIKINEVAARLGVSLGAAREALSRLAAERMATATAQKGFRVAEVSVEELEDLTRTRITIEQLCLRRSIENGDVEWETEMVAAYHRLHRIPEREPGDPSRLNEAWSAAHARFHSALVAACGSPWLLMIRDMLYAQTERYRRLSIPLQVRTRNIGREHKKLLDAVVARDADRACELIDDHLSRTATIVLSSPLLQRSERGVTRTSPTRIVA
jgi:DNA-binding GntR family transcriptional regulator